MLSYEQLAQMSVDEINDNWAEVNESLRILYKQMKEAPPLPESPYTFEQLAQMTPDEINDNWAEVKKALRILNEQKERN